MELCTSLCQLSLTQILPLYVFRICVFLDEIAIRELREIVPRAKLIFPIVLEWRNWHTQQTQNLPPVTRRGGSTPPSSTKQLTFNTRKCNHLPLVDPQMHPELLLATARS